MSTREQNGTVDALLRASRALVGVAARSLAELDEELTLPQWRALVLVQLRAPLTVGALSGLLAVHPSTATRLCDRLVAADLIERRPAPEDRREVELLATSAGVRMVDQVTQRRRDELARILRRIPAPQRAVLASALDDFSEAAGEAAADAWRLGWA